MCVVKTKQKAVHVFFFCLWLDLNVWNCGLPLYSTFYLYIYISRDYLVR